jgi:hypothetical protein
MQVEDRLEVLAVPALLADPELFVSSAMEQASRRTTLPLARLTSDA